MKTINISIYQRRLNKKTQSFERAISLDFSASTEKEGGIIELLPDIAGHMAKKFVRLSAGKTVEGAPMIKGFSANKETFFHVLSEDDGFNRTISRGLNSVFRRTAKIVQTSAPVYGAQKVDEDGKPVFKNDKPVLTIEKKGEYDRQLFTEQDIADSLLFVLTEMGDVTI